MKLIKYGRAIMSHDEGGGLHGFTMNTKYGKLLMSVPW